MPADGAAPAGRGRLLTGLAWAVLLLGLWLWGRNLTDGGLTQSPDTGDVAAVGRPPGRELPPAHPPLADSPSVRPSALAIDALGVRARIVERGLDAGGAVAAPPFTDPGLVGWYGAGPQPGAAGAAVLVGHVDTDTRRAVFYSLSSAVPGQRVTVRRSDGTVAEFTVEDVTVHQRENFDARRVYGAHAPGRAELRLITCGGTFDRERRLYSANIVVSAYLTGARRGA